MLAMFWNRSGTYCRTGLVVGYGGTWRARPASHRWVTAAGGRWHTHATTTGGGGGDRIDMWSPHTKRNESTLKRRKQQNRFLQFFFGTQKILEPKTTFQPLMFFRFHTP